MRFTGVVAVALLLSPIALSQTSDSNRTGVSPSVNVTPSGPQVQSPAAQTPQPPSYANYSIMLVNPAPGGGAVVLMHNPSNSLEYVPVGDTRDALAKGYVAVRAVELDELIGALREENTRLVVENNRLQNASRSAVPSQADLAAQQNAFKRQQMIQTWLTLQNMNRPQTQNLNVTVSDCTRQPALCAGR
ncbi:hypothetical protein H7849_23660 [Alloacidobacterium dinghuense]|uniref:Uncharacterized protein n=1 Tax=Alloacidobacterium dinghuense TaxID=2763107 RepID=A0A7G8BHF4_9BACT|nr:hypothetical protein [Alloacidobacterium dinghuense]QNI31974.1 hypothetical protein H7849_23660 [Alloacidobacterium dinghuense]